MPQTGVRDAAEIDRVLRSVLERPEFAPPAEPPLVRLLRSGVEWLLERVGDLLRLLVPEGLRSSPAWEGLGRVLLVVFATVGVAVIVQLVVLAVRSARRREARRAESGTGPSRPLTAEDWEARARSAVGEGRWRDAALALYTAVVHRLAQADRVRLDPGKTPGDYRRELARDEAVGPALARFVHAFELVAFGPAAPDRAAYRRLQTLAADLGAHG